MNKYLMIFYYSSGSWARMMRHPNDRVRIVSSVMEALGGSLDTYHWDLLNGAALVVANLPDSQAAGAVGIVTSGTGAFKNVEIHEMLGTDQVSNASTLAQNIADLYKVPGDPD